MQCPACQVTLQIADRQGIEIDYCPQCRGVWLDRGELDRLIDRSVGEGGSSSGRVNDSGSHYAAGDRERSDQERYHGQSGRRESWLSRLLDFD